MKFSADKHNKSNCYVCANAKPHLGTVPLNLPPDQEECFFSLYTNTHTNDSKCNLWKANYPLLTTNPHPGNTITVYPGNYTCYQPTKEGIIDLGTFPDGYCSETRNTSTGNHTRSLGDIYWLCGNKQLYINLKTSWKGQCALAKIIMPLHIITETIPSSDLLPRRRKREVSPGGSLDPHVYIDAIGVPRGVPNEFKARDQVAAGFESIFPIITVNKNVDWINYIYYNQQRFVNYTRDALQGLAEQLEATSQMTFQNRMALDMILAEKGGTCVYIDKVQGCCTYIPNSTGPNGKVTLAINKLTDLSEELKRNSGLDNPWDQYFGWLTNWKQALTQIIMIIFIVLGMAIFVIYCLLPCCKKLLSRGSEQLLYSASAQTSPGEYASYLTDYRKKRKQQLLLENHIV